MTSNNSNNDNVSFPLLPIPVGVSEVIAVFVRDNLWWDKFVPSGIYRLSLTWIVSNCLSPEISWVNPPQVLTNALPLYHVVVSKS